MENRHRAIIIRGLKLFSFFFFFLSTQKAMFQFPLFKRGISLQTEFSIKETTHRNAQAVVVK